MTFDLKVEAVAGFNAGVVGTVLGFPLDSIKTRMQTTHSSMFKASRMIFRENGMMGFYRGIASPLLSLTILNTLNFSSYSYFKTWLLSGHEGKAIGYLDWRIPAAAACVGPLSSMISTPFELVKTQMQLNNKSSSTAASTSSITTALNLVKSKGFSSLYVGHAINSLREVVFLSTYFTVYETLKLALSTDAMPVHIHPSVAVALSGGMSGALGWLVSFPLDCIKSNIQGQQLMTLDRSQLNNSAIKVGRELISRRGLLGLYSGQ